MTEEDTSETWKDSKNMTHFVVDNLETKIKLSTSSNVIKVRFLYFFFFEIISLIMYLLYVID